MPNETESKYQEPGMWDSFISSLNETQASHLHQLLLGKTTIGGSVKTENVQEKGQEENVSKDVAKSNNEPKYKCEHQLQSCKKPGCPVGGKPMGASYAADQLIKRNHRAKLKKCLFPDDKDGEEEGLKATPNTSTKVMPDNSAKVEPDDTAKVTPEKEKKKRKSSKPNKIDINKNQMKVKMTV